MPDAFGRGVDNGGIGGHSSGLEVESFAVLLVAENGRRKGQMPPRASAHHDDAFGIDTDDLSVAFEKTNCHADVFDSLHGIGAVLVKDPILNRHCDTTAGGEVVTVGHKLRGHGGVPKPTMKKKKTVQVGCLRVVTWRKEEVRAQRPLRRFVVDVGMGVLEELAIAGLADGRRLFELVNGRHEKKKGGRRAGSLSIVSRIMKTLFSIPLAFPLLFGLLSSSLPAQNQMQPVLEGVYNQWRQAIMTQNATRWSQTTSTRRQVEMRNRIFSERRPFPASLFMLPAAPPDLRGLTPAKLNVRGPTAKVVYFGKVNFGVGGTPTDNILVLSFVQESGWKYDGADFINLMALPEVRKELASGDYSSLDKPEFQPNGAPPQPPAIRLQGPVPYIAKVYCFAPGREVTVQVNRRSRHTVANRKAAEVVIGGANPGVNQVEYSIKSLPGSTGKEALAIRVFLMSEKQGVKIPSVFEYVVPEGGTVKSSGQGTFNLDQVLASKLR